MFWEIFSRLCAEQNIKPNPLAKKIGIPSASVTNWKNGRMPHETTLIKIADYFGVSVAYLKGETEEKKPLPASNLTLSPTDDLYHKISCLDDIDRGKVEGYVTGLLAAEKYQSPDKRKNA